MSFQRGADLLAILYQAMDQLTTTRIGAFVGDAYYVFPWLAIIWIILAGVRLMASSATAAQEGYGAVEVLKPIVRVVCVFCLLHYYNLNTLPGTNLYISNIFSEMGTYMAHHIDMTSLDTVNAKIAEIGSGSLVFALASPLASTGYFLFKLAFALISGALLLVSVLPFLLQGVGALFGPYFMVTPLIPFGAGSFLLRNWFLFMASMAFYRAAGAALLNVWCTALSLFIDHAIHGDYSLEHFMELGVLLGALTLGLLISLIFGIPMLVNALLHGSGAAAHSLGAAVIGAAGFVRSMGTKAVVSQGARAAQGAAQPVAQNTVKVKP
jgi:hypothetical protein